MKTQSTFNSIVVSTAIESDASEEGSSSVHFSLSTAPYREHEGGLPRSCPVPSDFPPVYSTFSTEEEELDTCGWSPEPHNNPSEIPWSPAAAYLSSFSPPSSTANAEGIPGYTFGSTIAHGAFSTIKEATSTSGGTVAVKIVRYSAFASLSPSERSRQRSRLFCEAHIWRSLSHENILPLFDSYKGPEALYLVTLYCPAGSLLDILKREGRPALEQTDVGYMFRQIVKALQYLHETVRLVHGDVKLENVMVDECGVCRLADFGLTRRIGSDSTQVSSGSDDDENGSTTRKEKRGRRSGTDGLPVHLSLLRHGGQRHRNSAPLTTGPTPPTHPDHMFLPGSLPYASPELLLPHSFSADAANGSSSRLIAHPAQDMWALGVLLYTLLTGTLPFRDAFEPRLQMKILRGSYDMPPGIGRHAESVLKGCLQRDVNERWTISHVYDAAWGIGYGDVELGPELLEGQRSQSEQNITPAGPKDDLVRSLSSWSITDTVPPSRRRPPFLTMRSLSRSPSPSIAPRTPDDEEFDLRSSGRRVTREDDGVQIILEETEGEWERRDGVMDEEAVGAERKADDLTQCSDDKQVERARGRQDALEDMKRRRSRSRAKAGCFTI